MIKKILSLVDQKLLRFIIVGCINTVVGTAIMFGLYNLASCSYWVSSAANYILTSILHSRIKNVHGSRWRNLSLT